MKIHKSQRHHQLHQASVLASKFQSLWFLPRKLLVCEVAILGSLVVDRFRKVQFFDNDAWTKVEVGKYNLDKLGRSLLRRAICINED